jgi:hypothetical protein
VLQRKSFASLAFPVPEGCGNYRTAGMGDAKLPSMDENDRKERGEDLMSFLKLLAIIAVIAFLLFIWSQPGDGSYQ